MTGLGLASARVARTAIALAAALTVAATLGACASPPIESETLPESSPAPEEVVLASGEATGTVLWGGVLVDGRNLEETTELEVLAYPLDRRQRPRTRRDSEGRFLIVVDGYLETLDYAKGRAVTVLGELDGLRDGRIGELEVSYPVVRAETLHLWDEGADAGRPRFTFGIGVNIGN